jgi:hypothetical protein
MYQKIKEITILIIIIYVLVVGTIFISKMMTEKKRSNDLTEKIGKIQQAKQENWSKIMKMPLKTRLSYLNSKYGGNK